MITRDDCATTSWPGMDQTVTIGSDDVLRISAVCDIMGVDRHTVYKLIDNDILPAIRVNARLLYIPRAAVQTLLTPSDSDGSRE